MEEKKEKYLFESMPVPKAVATLAIPTIISQVVTMIYNLADTFFIGQIGEIAGNGIVRFSGPPDQVEGSGGKLGGRTALEEQDMVFVRYLQQLAELGLRIVKNLLKYL